MYRKALIDWNQSENPTVTEEDKGLPYLSYSKESNFDHCPLSHKLKYVDKNFSKKSSLPMEIGSILHKALELKGRMIMEGKTVDYDYLKKHYRRGLFRDWWEVG